MGYYTTVIKDLALILYYLFLHFTHTYTEYPDIYVLLAYICPFKLSINISYPL
jgi:hypothetical protein